jgi:molybdopterin-guanine dinucleotide biosynthesis protein A
MLTGKEMTAAVLAGGQSRRMGQDKANVEIVGRTMLERVIERLSPLFGSLMIIGGESDPGDSCTVPVHPDLRPRMGSLGGIYTAVVLSPTEHVFCAACDMPFIGKEVVEHLIRLAGEGCDAVVPRIGGELEPLCALYSRNVRSVVERDLDCGVRRIKTTLSSLRVRVVEEEELIALDPELNTFFNINTPEDLEKARTIAASENP